MASRISYLLHVHLLLRSAMYKQLAAKSATRRPSVFEILLAKTLLWWIWEVVVTQKSALVELYPTLMPPNHMANINVC